MTRIQDALNRLFSHRFAPLIAFIAIAAAFAVVSQHELNKIRHTTGQEHVTQGQLGKTQLKLDRTQQSQSNAIRNGCVRLNITLADDNHSHFADYDFFRRVYIANRDAAATNAALLKKLGVVLPPKLKQDQIDEIAGLKRDMTSKTWTPLLDCNNITTSAYKLPRPIRFIKKLPPKSALALPPSPPGNPGNRGIKQIPTNRGPRGVIR